MQNAKCRIASLHFVSLTRKQFKCGVRSAERGTASLRFTSLTRKNFNAECRMQSAEWASLHFIPFTWFYLSLIDFGVWMQYEAKSSQQEEFTSGK